MLNHINRPFSRLARINTHHKNKHIKSSIKAKGAIKTKIKWNRKPTKGKCVFLCIFDHWALYAQTVFSLRAAAVVLHMGQGGGIRRHNDTKPPGHVGVLLPRQFGGGQRQRETE